ncbi:MAG TPA: hypothetical protein VJZ69_01670 [Clostridia bacterium]|nr:hypothetical protein [Clostridia bacterium]
MKKKIFEKILAIGNTTVALVFVIVLLVTMFGGIDAAEFNNSLLRGLFTSLGIVYLLLATGSVVYQFVDTDAVKEIVINTDKQTSTKATATVIKKIAKQHIATIEGVKCTKVVISLTEYGVRLKVGIKVVDKEIQEIAAVLKCLLEDVYYETLGYRFYAIDFKVLSLKSTYASDMEKIEEQAKENVEAQRLASKAALEKAAEQIDTDADAQKEVVEDIINSGNEVETEKTVETVELPKTAPEKKVAAKKVEKVKKEEISADTDEIAADSSDADEIIEDKTDEEAK